jgi:hypothetical protein
MQQQHGNAQRVSLFNVGEPDTTGKLNRIDSE